MGVNEIGCLTSHSNIFQLYMYHIPSTVFAMRTLFTTVWKKHRRWCLSHKPRAKITERGPRRGLIPTNSQLWYQPSNFNRYIQRKKTYLHNSQLWYQPSNVIAIFKEKRHIYILIFVKIKTCNHY